MKRWLSSRTLSGGFTLLELLVVVGLIAVVSGIVVAVLNQARQRADIAAAAQFEQSIGKALLADFDSAVVGVWNMNTNTGEEVIDSVNGSNLAVLGNATWDTNDTPLESGAVVECPTDNNNCLFVNGIRLKNQTELNAEADSDTTVMMWFKLDALPSAYFKRIMQIGPNYIFIRVFPDGQLRAQSAAAAIDLRYDKITPRRWYHVAMSYNDTSARLYINGRLEAVDEDVAHALFLTPHVYVGSGASYGSNMKVWNPRVFKSTAFLGQ